MQQRILASRLVTTSILTICAIFALLVLICSCGEESSRGAPSQKAGSGVNYTPPGEGATSIVQSLEARRSPDGKVNMVGNILLPQGTQVWVELFRQQPTSSHRSFAMSKSTLGPGGSLTAGPFDIPSVATVWVMVSSYFNGAWQTPEVLQLVGTEGTRLPTSLLVPDDPEFPESGGHLEHEASVCVPALSPEGQAIQAVKDSKLFVKGKGQAVDTVAEIVEYFGGSGCGFFPGEWSAEEAPDGRWTVHLPHRWGNDQVTANWGYDPVSGDVRYLDPEAKMLSWIPAE